MVFIGYLVGHMCLYDHAILMRVGGCVPGGALVIMLRIFLALLPSFVIIEKAPPWFICCCS